MSKGIQFIFLLTVLTFSDHVTGQELLSARKTDDVIRRVAILQETYVKGPAGLRERYHDRRLQQLPIMPPSPHLSMTMRSGFAAFQARDFPSTFVKSLIPVYRFGVEVYPVTVAESALTRETLFYNAGGKLIAKLAPVPGYNPYAWLMQPGSTFFSVNRTAEELAWELAIRDPARVKNYFELLPYNRIYEMAASMSTTLAASSETVSLNSKTELSVVGTMEAAAAAEPVTDIVIRSIRHDTNGTVLDIAWPAGFTNRLEVMARGSLAASGWTVLGPVIWTQGAESTLWTNRDMSGQALFYRIGNADLDSDGDGLPDAREIRVHGTGADLADTDSDALGDGREVMNGLSDPLLPDTDGDTLGDGTEVNGWAAWDIQSWPGCTWVDFSTTSDWVTNWLPGQVRDGWVNSGLSAPVMASLVLGNHTGTSFRVAVDGYLLIDSILPDPSLSDGINRELPDLSSEGLIAPFWDDLQVSAATGIWVRTSASSVVVTWLGAQVETSSGLNEGVDIQCEYTAADGSYTFRYRPAAGRAFPVSPMCTIGLQGPWGGVARVAFNDAPWFNAARTIRLKPAVSNPRKTDTDQDQWPDEIEAVLGLNPAVADDPESDRDGDGLTLAQEWESGTDPLKADTDGDGFMDGQEALWGMDPLMAEDPEADSDGDGLSNGAEWAYNCNPLQGDTDGDGASDWLEADQGSDPADFADSGLPPGDTFTVVVTLQTGEPEPLLPMGRAAAGGQIDGTSMESAQASLGEVGSTILQIGNFRLRSRPEKGGIAIGQFRLPKGRSYDIIVYNQDGQVQQVPVWTTIEVEGLPPIPVPNKPLWFCGPAVIENPSVAFGSREVTGSRSKAAKAVLTGLALEIEGPNGEKPPTSNWPMDSEVALTARLTPELAGLYAWTTDLETVQLDAQGDKATVRVDAQFTVTVTFSPAGSSGPSVSASALFRPDGHQCHWGQMVMSLAEEVPINQNDSDHNGLEDRGQSPPPPGDPDLRPMSLHFEEGDMLDCCRKLYTGARLTLSRPMGADRIRMWKEDGTAPFPMPFEDPVSAGSTWNAQVEGLDASLDQQDVALVADVSFATEPSQSWGWRTTVLRVTVLRPWGSADNFPSRVSSFNDLEQPYMYDWQAVADSKMPHGLHYPEGILAFPGVYDYVWTITPSCGSLERIHSAVPIHFPPAGVISPFQEGTLKLEAYRNGQPTGVSDERRIRVYDDHLRRDMENFVPENLMPFSCLDGVMKGGSHALGFTAHHSTSHALSGSLSDASWMSWACATSVVFYAPGYETPSFQGIERGDVIAYYIGGYLDHSQTCTGNGAETWGAANVPLEWNPGTQSYSSDPLIFATAPAGIHYQHANSSCFPLTIKLLKKPK